MRAIRPLRLWQPRQRSSVTRASTAGCGRGTAPGSLRATWQEEQPLPLPWMASSRFPRRVWRWQPAQSFAEVSLGGGRVGLRESLGHRRRPAWLGDLAEDPSVHRDDAARPRHERRGDPLRLADVAAGTAAGASHGAQRARLGLHAGVRAVLVEGELVPEVARRAADGGARVGAARVLLGADVAGDAALDLPAGAIGAAAERGRPLPLAAEGHEQPRERDEEADDERPRPEHQRAATRRRIVKAR